MKFKKPSNLLEGQNKTEKKAISEEKEMIACPICKRNIDKNELRDNQGLCPFCRHHFKISARRRICIICDCDSFVEIDKDLVSDNILGFPEYDKKLSGAKQKSNEIEGVVCGTGIICGIKAALFVMEPGFMMGSMGRVVGEKITRLFELAQEQNLPVVGFTVSGGARMQEGILSLMQMAKTSGAVKNHSLSGNLFVCVLTDPTTGGVTASFAMEGDIIIAEPGSLIGFAGPRVIEQTIRKKLPDGFQRAEVLLEKGFIDDIIDRKSQKKYISTLLKMHSKQGRAI